MNYSIQTIQTVAACDALILMVTKEKADHEFRKLSLTRQHESLSTNSLEDNAELTQITSELNTIIPIIASLPDSDYKTELISKRMKLETKKFDLENKVGDYDIKVKLDKELSITNAESAMQNSDDLLAQLTTRRAELSS